METSQFLSFLFLISLSLLSSSTASFTILAPLNAAGTPKPDLLGLHLIPVDLSLPNLKSLPIGAKIPTLLYGGSLTITSAISLNGVTVEGDPLYDDGSLIIYGIDKLFFRGGYLELQPPPPLNGPYCKASRVLRSNGWSTMAEFLDMQLYRRQVTVFAPDDQVFKMGDDWNQWPSLLLRHVVPGLLSSSDLSSLDHGSELETLLPGYTIIVSQNNSVSKVNGVRVMKPEIYQDDLIVVHGIGEVLQLPENSAEEEDEVAPS